MEERLILHDEQPERRPLLPILTHPSVRLKLKNIESLLNSHDTSGDERRNILGAANDVIIKIIPVSLDDALFSFSGQIYRREHANAPYTGELARYDDMQCRGFDSIEVGGWRYLTLSFAAAERFDAETGEPVVDQCHVIPDIEHLTDISYLRQEKC